MADNERLAGERHQESEVEAVRDNLLKLLRLLAKEVARCLAGSTDNTGSNSGPP